MKHLLFSLSIGLFSVAYFCQGYALLERTPAKPAMRPCQSSVTTSVPATSLGSVASDLPVLEPGPFAFCPPCLTGSPAPLKDTIASDQHLSGMEWRCAGCDMVYLGPK